MRVMRRAAWIFTALLPWALLTSLLGGCSQTNLADIIKAAATDQATNCFRLTLSTPWGTQTTMGSRTNITNGDVQCTADGGLTVRSQPPSMPVGVQLVPAR